jgi:hypothetical protein
VTPAARVAACAAFLLAGLGPALHGAAAAEASATPQRPSLSFNTLTAPARRFEMEIGGSVADGADALPLFLKYGLTDRTELEVGFDGVRRVDTAGGPVTSQGDLSLWIRTRPSWGHGGRSVAGLGWVKAPTARDGAGSGKIDAGVIGVLSLPLGRQSLDANLWVSALGREDGTTLGQAQGILTLNLPGPGDWSSFAEIAWQRTAGEGDGGFFDAGVAFAASPRAVFNAAAGAGWSEGYPDWVVTAGWAILFPGRR